MQVGSGPSQQLDLAPSHRPSASSQDCAQHSSVRGIAHAVTCKQGKHPRQGEQEEQGGAGETHFA